MTGWRPKNWSPILERHIGATHTETFEAGADAMLEAVCAEVRILHALNPYGGELASAGHYRREGWHRACMRLLRTFVVKETK